jgi:two-component system, chemotaxis family, sensor kinase CheA
VEERVSIPEEDEAMVADFVHKNMVLLRQVQPLVRELIQEPRDEVVKQAAMESCWRLFHDIQKTGRLFRFEYLLGPANVMEHLLERARSGLLSLGPLHISLLAESCRFIEQGLLLVLAEKNDQRLATPAAELSAAILRSIVMEQKAEPDGGARSAALVSMREVFYRETEWLLEKAEQEFVLWDFIAMDQQRVTDLDRLLHRLQGNFAFFELTEPEQICRALVSILKRYLKGDFFQTEYPERVFLRSIDAVRDALSRYAAVEDAAVEGLGEHLDALQGIMRQPIGSLLIEAGLVDPLAVDEALRVQESRRQEKPLRLGEVLVDMGKVTRDQVDHILREQRRKQVAAEQSVAQVLPGTPPPHADLLLSAAQFYISIDSQKFAEMLDLVKGLAAAGRGGERTVSKVTELLESMESCNREAMPAFLSRLKRVVHELAAKYDKQVCFIVEGAGSLPGQRDLVLLAEPIFHLLRNAIEHGLEKAREREMSGKDKECRLTLGVLRWDDALWVSVEDDGCGMDIDTIAAMVVARGFAGREEIKRLSGRERIGLFVPHEHEIGLTGESVRRPCGFFAVNKGVERLGGNIDVLSRPGKGTRITLKIPCRH